MPELISSISSCSAVASLCSTIAATAPSASRTHPAVAGRVGDPGGEHGDGVRPVGVGGRAGHAACRWTGAARRRTSRRPCRSAGAAPPARTRRPGRCRGPRPGRRRRRPGRPPRRARRRASRSWPYDDHEVLGVEPARGCHRVTQQAAAAEGVQHLRGRRPHAGALASGEDDDRGRAGLAQRRELLGVAGGRQNRGYRPFTASVTAASPTAAGAANGDLRRGSRKRIRTPTNRTKTCGAADYTIRDRG